VAFRAGEELIQEGAIGTDAYFLLSSYVKVTAQLRDGGTALLAVRVGGDVVGEVAATDPDRRLATVRACGLEPVYALELAREDFTRVMSTHPDSLLRLTQMVSRKLRTATRRRVDFTGCTALVCMARVLVELADDYGVPTGNGIVIGIDLTQLELGTLIGFQVSSAQRSLRELRRQGLVNTRNRRPIIRDISALRRLAALEHGASNEGP
jgi:CRP/FNR family transcriptional regulator, cyclic AMP receptor protein